MSVRTPSPSIFRPSRGIRQTALKENEALVRDINRRNLLRGTVSLGALSFLTGCDVKDSSAVRSMLLAVSAWNDTVQEFIFRPGHLAPTFSEAQVLKPPRFNAHYPIEDVRPVDAATWRAALRTRDPGAPMSSMRFRSRSSLSGIFAWKGGTILASGPA
jgi:hypothetical protein